MLRVIPSYHGGEGGGRGGSNNYSLGHFMLEILSAYHPGGEVQ